MNFEDVTGRSIDIGDVILYTMSTDGSAASMQCGEVTKFLPKSLKVKPLDPATLGPLMRQDGFSRGTGVWYTQSPGTAWERKYEQTEWIRTDDVETEEHNIPKPEPYRFYILRKI